MATAPRNTLAPTAPDNRVAPAQIEPGRYFSRAYEQEAQAFNQPCKFRGAMMHNKSAATTLYMLIMDSRDNSPKFPMLPPIQVPAGATGSIDWSNAPRFMRDGIYICASTAPDLKTLEAAGTNNAFFEVAFDIPYPA